MKRHYGLIGLYFLGLLVSSGLADISLTLRDSGGQPYLPPPIEEVPINEEYYNDADTNAQTQSNGFEESKYGDGKYHIFEVHNHFEPTSDEQTQQERDPTTQSNYKANGYLPPHQQIHAQKEDNLDVSLLSLAAVGDQGQVTITANVPSPIATPTTASYQNENSRRVTQLEEGVYRGAEYLPPKRKGSYDNDDFRKSNFRASEYLPPDVTEQFQGPEYLPPYEAQSHFKGPDYLPPHDGAKHSHESSYKGPDYLPPLEGRQLGQQSQAFKGPDYLPPLQGHQGAQQENKFKGPDYLPPLQDHRGAQQENKFKGPDYLPPLEGHHGAQQKQPFKGPDYLPPHAGHHSEQREPLFKGPEYLPPFEGHQGAQQDAQFKGPDYLPPLKSSYEAPSGREASYESENTPSSHAYRAPDYLPPHDGSQHESVQSTESTSFKGLDYLPPHQEHNSQSAFKGPDYLPPASAQRTRQGKFKAPDYLPPHTETVQQQHGSAIFSGPDYLPPHQNGLRSNTAGEYSAPDYLPPGYDFVNPEVNTQQEQQHDFIPGPTSQLREPFRASQELPAGYEFSKPANADEAIAELHSVQRQQQQREQVPAVTYGHRTAPLISVESNSKFQSNGGNGYLPPANGKDSTPFLPIAPPTQASFEVQQADVQILAPYNNDVRQSYQQQESYRATDYLPPVATTATPSQQSQQSNLHSLSSYMTSVEPFQQRYGDAQYTEPRKPFREYGPPSSRPPVVHAAPQPTATTTFDVAPMYREQSTRSQYYAPAMSYNTNAIAQTFATYDTPTPPTAATAFRQPEPTYTLSEQVKQSLQRFMPKEIQVQAYSAPTAGATTTLQATPTAASVAAVHAAALPAAGKIRTVQIINTNAVKTLKVLESSDQNGVKTIKILGTSNENPTGQHRIVKVVSQSPHDSGENSVQTVKIFDEVINSNEYLPPTSRTSKRSVSLSRQLFHLRHGFTGRGRLRYY